MPRFESSEVQRFYDRQTAGFVALGQGGGEGAIHRAVWGPGVSTRSEAFHFVEDRIAEVLRTKQRGVRSEFRGFSPGETSPHAGTFHADDAVPHVVDLGCGVGGSLIYLAGRLPIRGTGITLSPVQATLARERIRQLDLEQSVSCLAADFTRLPDSVRDADLAFAIEAFVHAPSAEAFFQECASLVRPGGHLVVCDDWLVHTPTRRALQVVDQFRRGWHVNTLLTEPQVIAHAAKAGFVHEQTLTLTPWLELRRPRDRAIALFVSLFGWLPLARTPVAHVVGGSALQTGLRNGWLQHAMVRFRKAVS